jgi:hypothetical protein
MIELDRKILNNYINSNKINELTEYVSGKLNIHNERLTIVKIDEFETAKLKIDKNNQFVICLNNSIHETVSINNISFDEVLCIDNTDDIIINSKIIYTDLRFVVFNDNCKKSKNSIDLINKYKLQDPSNNIFVIDESEIISQSECEYFRNIINNNIDNNQYVLKQWEQGNNVSCKTFLIKDSLMYQHANVAIHKEIKNKTNKIFEKLHIYLQKKHGIVSKSNSGYQFRKIYGSTRIHKDGIFDIANKIELNVTRVASVIICLNDDYEGGEFYFPVQDITIKLKKGQILVFPPYWTHPHLTMELKNRSYRYTINSWLYENHEKLISNAK